MLRLYLAGGEIDIGQGVKLGHDDVDIVSTDAGGQKGDPLSVVFAGDGYELAGLMAELLVLKESGSHVHTAGIAEYNDPVCKLFRPQMDMECGTVSVDDQFRLRYSHILQF